MIPVFGEIFGEPIPAYFALLMVGYALAIYIAARWATRLGLDREVIIDLGLLSLVVGVAGGRILHVLADGFFWDYVHLCTDPSQVVWRTVTSTAECTQLGGGWGADQLCRPLERDCFAWAKFWNGGLAYYGGLIAVIPTSIWFLRREGFPVGKAADLAGVVAPLGIVFGRLGCFFGGCCFGLHTDHAFGVSFPPWSPASEEQFRHGLLAAKSLPSLPVHPTQLYEAVGCAVISAVMAFYVVPRKRFDGQVFLSFLASYAVLRFLIEYVRADDRGALLGMSTSQVIGLAMLGGVAWAWQRMERPKVG
jgi:phosphatidylglycerol:prolipoprotein diacylglycerol transferase